MTIEEVCKGFGIKDIGEFSDGYHTFNSLYHQRMILFAALVDVYKEKAWKSRKHSDGEECFGGGWFIVGIDTPQGSYTYHYETRYWNLFNCQELDRGKEWDGHTDKDVERLLSLGHKNVLDELSVINQYSKKELTQEDIYVFLLTLCDNEIDQDFERFTLKTLKELAVLFAGKTGIFDHKGKSEGQSAQIFRTWVEIDDSRATSCGEPYATLKARAYIVRTPQNQNLIYEIEDGIKKDISFVCAVQHCYCSFCGTERKIGCQHIKGKIIGDELCHDVLEDAEDIYIENIL